jgi:putative DNA primase/helicase
MLPVISNFLSRILPARDTIASRASIAIEQTREPLQAVGINDFLSLDIPPRAMLLDPILPERSLAMLYAPRGLGKSWLALSIGLAVASGAPLLRWSAPRQRNVLYVDGEMPLVSLQERLKAISVPFGTDIPNSSNGRCLI